MGLPNCDYFSAIEKNEGIYAHFCSASGISKSIIRGIDCARCSKNKNVIVPLGYIYFTYNQGDIDCYKFEYDNPFDKEMNSRETIGDLMSGKNFYELVSNLTLQDYDGSLSTVYVNGYTSNLGLNHEGICQGKFIVDGKTWLALCEEFDIKVEWCNR